MAHDVFISYSSRDKAVADGVCAFLEGRKLRCWIAPRDVPAGKEWSGALIEAIGKSRVLVLVFSNGANESPQVLREIAAAAKREIPILPLRVENVEPSQAIGFYIEPIHWLDALTPPLERHLEKLAATVARLLAPEGAGEAVRTAAEGGPSTPAAGARAQALPWLRLPRWAVVALALALLLSVSVGAWRLAAGIRPGPSATRTVKLGLVPAATSQQTSAPAGSASPALATGPSTPRPTETPAAPAASLPSPTLPAASTPAAVPTAVVWAGLPAIEPSNAAQMRELHRFGKGYAVAVAWSPDGGTLAVGSSLGAWLYDEGDWRDGRLLANPPGESLSAIAFSPDGKALVGGSAGGKLWSWDLQAMTVQGGPWQTGGAIRVLAMSPDGTWVATAGDDSTIRLWDLQAGSSLQTLTGSSTAGRSVAISPDGRTLASTAEGCFLLWDLETGSLLKRVAVQVAFVGFRPPDGALIAGTTQQIFVLDPRSGELLKTVPTGDTGYVAAFNRDGTLLASGQYGRAMIVNTQTWQVVAALGDKNPGVDSLAFGGAKGNLLATRPYAAPYVQIWDVATHQQVGTVTGYLRYVEAIQPLPNGRILAAGAYQNVYLWDVLSGQISTTLESDRYNSRIVFSADGSQVATTSPGTEDTHVRLWDAASGTLAHELDGTKYMGVMAFSPDGRLFAETGINPGDGAKLWDAKTGAQLKDWPGAEGRTPSLAFDPQGKVLALGLGDGTVRLFGVGPCGQSGSECGALIAEGQKHFSEVAALAFSPDGQTLASGSTDQQVILWKVQDGTTLATLAGHTGEVRFVAFSPDGTRLVSQARNGEALLWDVSARKELYRLAGPTWGQPPAFSPDGRLLAWAAAKDVVAVLNVATGAQLNSLAGNAEGGHPLVFSRDGKLLVSTGSDATVRVWGIPSASPALTPPPAEPPSGLGSTVAPTATLGVPARTTAEGIMIQSADNQLEIDSEDVMFELSLRDFVAEATFHNPCSASEAPWGYGFVYRWQGQTYARVTIHSYGTWSHVLYAGGTEQVLQAGNSDAGLATGAGESNVVRLSVRGDRGELWVNGTIVTQIDASALSQAGNVMVTIDLLPGTCLDRETRFSGFTVWSVD